MFLNDKVLTCVECGGEFTFTLADQEFYSSRGYQEPKRCPQCRQARRSARPTTTSERQMFTVVCSSCGNQANVPFQPRQDRPVYCDACYAKVRPQRPSWA